MEGRAAAVAADVEDRRGGRHALKLLHLARVDAEAPERGEHEVGLLVVADRTHRKAVQAQLGEIDHRAARRSRDGQANLVDEGDLPPGGMASTGRPRTSRM